MKTADCILREVTEVPDFFDGTEIIEAEVTWQQAIEAMERYAAQFFPAETPTHTDGIRILTDEELSAEQAARDQAYLESYATYGSELANKPPKI